MKIVTSFLVLAFCLSMSAFAGRIEVDIQGMTCGMCVESITKELRSTEKADNIKVDLEAKKASFSEVRGKSISDAEVKAAIKKAGYQAMKVMRK